MNIIWRYCSFAYSNECINYIIISKHLPVIFSAALYRDN